MIGGVIFDADGTLIDSMGFWTSTVFDIIAMSGIEPEDGLIATLTPMSMIEGAEYMKAHYDIPMTVEEMVERENSLVHTFYKTQVTLRPGVLETVERLAERGIPMVVASATERGMIESALRHTGILGRFRAVLSCSDVGSGKDKPDIFLEACRILGTSPSETLVVEDSPTAVATAKAAGLQTMLIGEEEAMNDRIGKETDLV